MNKLCGKRTVPEGLKDALKPLNDLFAENNGQSPLSDEPDAKADQEFAAVALTVVIKTFFGGQQFKEGRTRLCFGFHSRLIGN